MSRALLPRETVRVAVGVLVRGDGDVLLADRPAGKPYAGYWEFPGGKIEPGESVESALARELHEELGIDVGTSTPWVVFEHDYPHAYVRLHFRRVFEWRGDPHPREGQRVGFFSAAGPLPAPLLPAAVPAMRWLTLPDIYAVSNIAALGAENFQRALQRALDRGLRLLLLREPELDNVQLRAIAPSVLAQSHASGARVLVSSRHASALPGRFDGVHLTANDLARTQQRPRADLVAASVHTRDELVQAHAFGCDFAILGPVHATASHPGAPPLEWSGFELIARDTPIPLYGIGGLTIADLAGARRAGAHGIALLRAAWNRR
ncbi:MAG: Nudix family hydrolase [Gemmatimonadota bacterium]